ncbi:uncharacterized protein LOC131624435 [Vicia villosa]|uniref:uncharacterized protein LOC131624435 n=1 Tax=Vicia villosa TaxID=3911 RepID=UPI00273BFA14|nr:uncharacterized protein LOC131624435 [Vicia villosa]
MTVVRTVSYRYIINGQVSEIVKAKRGLRQGDPVSPLLFVLVMEYLHRCLAGLKETPGFTHHPRCAKFNITNICFADDLMLFSKGEDQQTILRTTQFVEGKLPVRYLGVPLSSRKIYIAQCQPLIDKMTMRIQHWSVKLLSYAGRLQLINSVFMAISNYWMQAFPIPKKVIAKVESIYKNFLWSAKAEARKAYVSWENLREPKNAGGLHVRDLQLWNTIMMIKLLWNIHMKMDKLWIRWLDSYFMKGTPILQWLTNKIWKEMLEWNGYDRSIRQWPQEQNWLIQEMGKKGWRREILIVTLTETVYQIWLCRNEAVFNNILPRVDITKAIQERVVHRCLPHRKLNPHVNGSAMRLS